MKSAVIDYWTLRAPLVLFFSEDRGAYEPADSKLLAGCTIGEGEPLSCDQVWLGMMFLLGAGTYMVAVVLSALLSGLLL